MSVQAGDKLIYIRQTDGSYNVVADLKHADGDRRIVANVDDPDAFYTKVRDMIDNPPARDYESEKEMLLVRKSHIEADIVEVDNMIAIKAAREKL